MASKLIKGWRYCEHLHRMQFLHVSRSSHPRPAHVSYPRIKANLKCGARIDELKNELRIIMGMENIYNKNANIGKQNQMNTYLVEKSVELPARSINDSFLSGIIPLSSDEKLQNKYLSNLGNIRYGRLIEDMDIFAVMVVQKYILNPKIPISLPSPYNVVTILMDSVILNKYTAHPNEDVRISGHISNVGRTSAEVVVWLEQKTNGNWNNLMQAKFLLAARDPSNKRGAVINPLLPANAIEMEHIKGAQEQRKQMAEPKHKITAKSYPTTQEQALLHQMFIKATKGQPTPKVDTLPTGYRWMSDTSASNLLLSFPENRNLYNTIFGGYIMRQAIELGFATCFLYTKRRARLVGIGEVKFQRPIPIGAIIRMNAKIAYAKHNYMQVAIHANAINHIEGSELSTNTFQLTFEVPATVQEVFPKSYMESIQFIDAARNMEATIQLIDKPFRYIDFNKMQTSSQPTKKIS